MTRRAPIRDRVRGLRQRRRKDGSWRVWWEPSAAERAAGIGPVELDPDRPTWSARMADEQNEAARAATTAGPATTTNRANARTIDALIDRYRDHRWYLKKAAATRRGYDGFLRAISREFGQRRAGGITADAMQAWHDRLAAGAGPNYATKMTGMMSVLMRLAERLGWRARGTNPCADLDREAQAARARYASWDEFDALSRAAMRAGLPSIACAVALSFLAGQRQTDIIRARADDFRRVPTTPGTPCGTWVWSFTRSKNRRAGMLPLHPELIPQVSRMKALRGGDGHTTLLIEERLHRAYDPPLFAARWGEVRRAAACACPSLLAENDCLQFRDLRRSAATWARIGGASIEDVGDMIGNTVADNPTLAATYMPPTFQTAARAVAAISRPAPARDTDPTRRISDA